MIRRNRRLRYCLSLATAARAAAVGAVAACAVAVCAVAHAQAVDDDDLANAGSGDSGAEWLTHGRDYAETRFSPLDRINDGNVADLGVAWTLDTGTFRGLEATPLVADGVLYATRPWSSVFAVDARSGRLLWDYDPQVDRSMGWKACCDVVNRGVALYDGKVYAGILDGRLVALDAASGEPIWQVQTTDPDRPYTITGAPRVAAGLVIIGNGGAELGSRGYVTAYDAKTGDERWRFWVVPGNPDDGFENPDVERAAQTWSGNWWEVGGGGNAWDAIAYDPQAGRVYIPTQDNSFAFATQADFDFTPGTWNRGIATGALDALARFPEAAYGEGTGPRRPAVGTLLAWDPVAGRVRWQADYATHSNGGTLTTAGNLVFHGSAAGHLAAYRADNGARVWDVDLGQGILAAPITYLLDGEQYLSVLAGWGGTTSLFGYNASGEYKAEGRLWTFVLGGDREIEPVRGSNKPRLTAIDYDDSPAGLARGAYLYAQRCVMCHGGGAASGGAIADLRYSTAATFGIFAQIVREGAYANLGMPDLGEVVSASDADAIKNYLLAQRALLIDAD